MNEEKLAEMAAIIARAFGWEIGIHTRGGDVVGISISDSQIMDHLADEFPDMNVWGMKEIDG